MADQENVPEQETRDVADPQEEILHADGSSARASTQDGVLSHDDVENAPLLQGTDPLSDDAIESRRGGRLSSQGILFALLAVVFAGFFISDLMHAEWGRAVLGAVVLAICVAALVREVQARKR